MPGVPWQRPWSSRPWGPLRARRARRRRGRGPRRGSPTRRQRRLVRPWSTGDRSLRPVGRELRTRRARPVGEAVLAERMSCENGGAHVCNGIFPLEAKQGECVPGGTVESTEAAIVVVLPPESIVAAALPQRGGRLARRVAPPALTRPLVHCECGEERSGRPN